ncbi:helix-turn-helix domain-containing protein [Frankia nepalensis]|uniref:helix-turn-helix domain-containing protein n=1 Tax=Frankia nepalensis TaxID=1836974 RepID=UPI0027DD3F5D|nr:helix-turn-helix transcriptional regulator [Frankia nepalensis]
MTPTLTQLRARSADLRGLGWSYRRIATHWQLAYRLGALLAFRLAHGWTQEEAAWRWNARWPADPKTAKSFSYWETWPGSGGRAPSPRTLARLAELYLCRPGDLLDGVDHGVLDPGLDADEAPGGRCWPGGGCQPGPPGRVGAVPAANGLAVPPDPDFELDLGMAFGQQLVAAAQEPPSGATEDVLAG